MEVISWKNDRLQILDQTKLPAEVVYLSCFDCREVAEAIKKMCIRGAPALGIAAGFGMALAALKYSPNKSCSLGDYLNEAAALLKKTRPTAVNLVWALEQMLKVYRQLEHKPLEEIKAGILEAAQQLLLDERERDEKIASFGSDLIPKGSRILTYCNTGALATGGLGTALGVVIKAYRQGKGIHVYVSETRPVLQGARLTAWELQQEGVPFTLITDNMAGYLFQKGLADVIIVGADRIAANGDFANKIGTSALAVLAEYYRRPFYVAAPLSTVDLKIPSGQDIPVEMRNPEEVKRVKGELVTVPDCRVLNPSFDITPKSQVTAFITEYGVVRPPFDKALQMFNKKEEYKMG